MQNPATQNKVKSRYTRQILCFYYISLTLKSVVAVSALFPFVLKND